jgi:hypothetical protein
LDIDFLVPASAIEQAIEAAASCGCDDISGWIVLRSNGHGIDRLFRINKIQDEDLLSLDLLETNHLENPIFSNRETFEIQGHSVQLLSRAC